MTKMLLLPEALRNAGLNVKTLDGWDKPHFLNGKDYDWREPDGNPAGVMWHHTATSSYTPNRDKANLFIGQGYDHLDRLSMEDYGDEHLPYVVVANAYPAPISSGYGVRAVLEQFVKQDIPFRGRQTQPDDNWAGNTHYVNIEMVCKGDGSKMAQETWDILDTVGIVLNHVLDFQSAARHIAHSYHTGRKIDYYDGRYDNADQTVQAIRKMIEMIDPACPWTNDDYPACELVEGKLGHYFPPSDLPKGNGKGENQGSCSVPVAQQASVAWAFSDVDNKRYYLGNQHRYDYSAIMTEGRENAFEYRDAGSPSVPT